MCSGCVFDSITHLANGRGSNAKLLTFPINSRIVSLGYSEVCVLVERPWLRVLMVALVLALVCVPFGMSLPVQAQAAGFGVVLSPSSLVLKVGDKAGINVTITNPERVNGTQVCYTLEGFPSSGFRSSFTPECSSSNNGGFDSVLTVEVTPAAAPQTVQGVVVASSGTASAQAVLNLTVEPAMPAWIPWLGLILFFSVLALAIVWKPNLSRKKPSSTTKKRTRR